MLKSQFLKAKEIIHKGKIKWAKSIQEMKSGRVTITRDVPYGKHEESCTLQSRRSISEV